MNIKYRFAYYSDISRILDLYEELIDYHLHLEPEFFKRGKQSRIFLERIINNDESDIVLALDNEIVVGFVLMQKEQSVNLSMLKVYSYAYLTDIFVSEGYRGHGIGQQLIHFCEQWAKQEGLDYIELNVWAKNVDAIKLYEKCGFKNRILTMNKRVED